ncbi:hypothetical protein COV15_00605 [Candidatus Woesearchaeota archaeon CG10_big_fil_rev_8_21_14_0_10_34_12]|nr:MAG: hypothetical protein COV15_00605 [Candidatus Woesearchaeota archaeon CG10_big_fil_rev_8_21_14_0_10_34_12]
MKLFFVAEGKLFENGFEYGEGLEKFLPKIEFDFNIEPETEATKKWWVHHHLSLKRKAKDLVNRKIHAVYGRKKQINRFNICQEDLEEFCTKPSGAISYVSETLSLERWEADFPEFSIILERPSIDSRLGEILADEEVGKIIVCSKVRCIDRKSIECQNKKPKIADYVKADRNIDKFYDLAIAEGITPGYSYPKIGTTIRETPISKKLILPGYEENIQAYIEIARTILREM